MRLTVAIFSLFVFSFICCCQTKEQSNKSDNLPKEKSASINIVEDHFGRIGERDVLIFTIQNQQGTKVKITNYGATITSIKTNDKNGQPGEIVLGFDSLPGYTGRHPHYGNTIGRFANRIGGASFTLEGKSYQLARNSGSNHIHGGESGFDEKIWEAESFSLDTIAGVSMSYFSKHLEEGYPGNLEVRVDFSLNNENELMIDYTAHTDQTTIINLTNHSYFNLNPSASQVLDHEVKLYASRYTPVDEEQIPTGQVLPVANTPFDFTNLKKIGRDLESTANGYDHNFVVDQISGLDLVPAAFIYERESGRTMEVLTTKPGMQFFTANFPDDRYQSRGKLLKKHGAFCVETQYFPDAPNHENFPEAVLRPGEIYHHQTIFKFGIKP